MKKVAAVNPDAVQAMAKEGNVLAGTAVSAVQNF